MKVLNDFKCLGCDDQDEYFVDNSAREVVCRCCGATATKVRTVPNFSLPGNDPSGFPTAYDQWAKKREQKMKEEQRQQPN